MNKLSILSIVATLVVFFSCKKENKQKEIEFFQQKDIQSSIDFNTSPPEAHPWVDATNTNNPQDNAGYFHNAQLQYVFSNLGADESNLNIYNQSLNFAQSVFGISVRNQVSVEFPWSSAQQLFGQISNGSLLSSVNSLPVSQNAKNKLNELISELTDTTTSFFGNYELTKDRIVTWENSLSSTNLSQAERANLLGTGAVTRFSFLYWKIQDDNLFGLNKSGFFKRLLGWCLVGLSDAIGYFVGGGGVTGVIVGGAGSTAAYFIFKGRGWEP